MLGRRWEGRAAPSAIPDLKGRASPPRGHLPSPRGLTLGPVPGAGVPREPPLGSVPARRLHLWSLTARQPQALGGTNLTPLRSSPAPPPPRCRLATPPRACARAEVPVPGRTRRWRRPMRKRRRRIGNTPLSPVPTAPAQRGRRRRRLTPVPVPAGRCRRRWRCWSPSTWRSCGWLGAAAGTDRGPASPGPARPRAAAPHLGLPRRWEPWEIGITLHPATAQDQDSQYVRFTLMLSVPPQVGRRPCTPAPDLSASLVVLCVFLFSLVSQQSSGNLDQEPARTVR